MSRTECGGLSQGTKVYVRVYSGVVGYDHLIYTH